MAVPAMKPDRRRTPRTNLAGLAYVNFEPDNGGIVLNISEEGLCFHAVAPVQRGATLPFSLSANGNCIEAVGLLAWTDEPRKSGGLRFNGLSPDARRQIRALIEEFSKPLAHAKDLAAGAVGRAPKRLPNATPAVASAATRVLSQWIGAPLRWGDFSRGLATGLLVALFVAAGFLLDAHRRQIGSFLIRLGERVEATPQHETAPNVAGTSTPSAPSSATTATSWRRAATLATGAAAPASRPSMSARGDENLPPQPALKTRPRVNPKVASTTPAPTLAPPPAAPLSSLMPASAPPPPVATDTSQPSRPASPAAASNASNVVARAADQPGDNENAEDVVEINSGIPLGRYFDVAKPKDAFAANQIESHLSDLGFRSIVLPRSLLWMKSYQVLVGPYRNQQDAEGARQSLESKGYKPRSLAKRSRQLILLASWMNPDHVSDQDTDNLIVTWEAYSAQATVKFVKKGETLGTAVGKWAKLPGPSEYTEIVYTTADAGKRTLLSIRFQGMKQAVMLPNSADRGIVF